MSFLRKPIMLFQLSQMAAGVTLVIMCAAAAAFSFLGNAALSGAWVPSHCCVECVAWRCRSAVYHAEAADGGEPCSPSYTNSGYFLYCFAM